MYVIKYSRKQSVSLAKNIFSNFSPILFFQLCSCSNVLDLKNLQEQLEKAFGFKNCTDLSMFR